MRKGTNPLPPTMIKGKTKSNLITKINESKDRIAKERDHLRELIEDAESVCDSCDKAVLHLEDAADSLSEYL